MKESVNKITYNVPTWRYRYYADWDNTRIFPTSGAYHGVELHMLFGNSQGVTGVPESWAQKRLKRNMQKAWATFAADPRHGLSKLGWPTFKRNSK